MTSKNLSFLMWHPKSSILQGNGDNEKTMYNMDSDTERNTLLKWVYFYQGHYTASGHIAEVTDDDAIAQAEAEYNVKKSKLNYKEESLELKMKNIDTELSALTTEYDTVKNLISKNVEKVFTMFSS